MKYLILPTLLALAGCEPTSTDQCLRAQEFHACRDGSTDPDVIRVCSDHAYYTAQRLVAEIPPACRATSF